MKNKYIIPIVMMLSMSVALVSCFNDLDLDPRYGRDAVDVYESPEEYIHVLAKLYAGLAITGNEGPAGNPDIGGIDEGFSAYIRVLWNMQELPTDEALCAWGDPGIPELNKMSWSSTNSFVTAMYYRIFFQIPLCNEFIRESSDEKMNERGFSSADQERIRGYRNEARFLRALSYYHAMDIFGSVPFITEDDEPGAFFPPQISRVDLFNYIESELLAIEATMMAPQANEYGRADKAAVWSLLAKMYLNAEVYTGTDRYADCATYCSKVINEGGYTLEPNYEQLFFADNDNSNEIIFPVTFDGLFTQTFGGPTFLVHSAVGTTGPSSDIDFSYYGIEAGWGGNRATPEFAEILNDPDDGRNLMFTEGQTLTFSTDGDLSNFLIGYGIAKWRNVKEVASFTGSITDTTLTVTAVAEGSLSVGQYIYGPGMTKGTQITGLLTGAGGTGTYDISVAQEVTSTTISAYVGGVDETYVDNDFPMFRLADIYLMYAECAARGAADLGTGIGYVNALRERAYGDASHNVAALTPQDVLDERARELYWEATRRTDLIRFGQFTGGEYIWAFKGGSYTGSTVSEHLNLYPLPASDVVANPNLDQNEGY